ncbi:MAG TPA: hypothetical protein DCX22_03865 [Dehalococcoidia bacterium]|nr:hypothetical protein [Dehalococcoidia bacterium]
MKCPFCNREYLTQEEVMNCVAKHMRDSQEEQVRQVEKQNIMVMASQLTMASLASHTSARDVVQRFGEIYELLQSVAQKSDVASEIERWLIDKDKGNQ